MGLSHPRSDVDTGRVEMFAAPAEGTLKRFMKFAETCFADPEQSAAKPADSRHRALREVDKSQ